MSFPGLPDLHSTSSACQRLSKLYHHHRLRLPKREQLLLWASTAEAVTSGSLVAVLLTQMTS